MKKAKLISLLLVGTILSTSFIGCGKKENLSIQDSFLQQLSNLTRYSSLDINVSIDENYIKENTPGNVLSESIIDISEASTRTSTISGKLDIESSSVSLAFAQKENDKSANLASFVYTKGANYAKIGNIEKINDSYFKTIIDNMDGDKNFLNLDITNEKLENAKYYEEYAKDDFVIFSFEDMSSYNEEMIVPSSLTSESLNKSVADSLEDIDKKYEVDKQFAYASLKTLIEAYASPIVNYDEDASYYYLLFNPEQYKEFTNGLAYVMDKSLESTMPELFKAYLDRSPTNKEMESYKNFINSLYAYSEDINGGFQTICFAFFPGIDSCKFVIQKTLSEKEKTTITIDIKSSSDVKVSIPSNVVKYKDINEEVLETVRKEQEEKELEKQQEQLEKESSLRLVENLKTTIVAAKAELASNLYSKQIQINDVVYQMPIGNVTIDGLFSFENFEFPEEFKPIPEKEDKKKKKEEPIYTSYDEIYEIKSMKKDDSTKSLIVNSKVDNAICYMYFSCDYMADKDTLKVVLPSGIQIGKTYIDMIDAYGYPTNYALNQEKNSYTYESDDYVVTFFLKDNIIVDIEIYRKDDVFTYEFRKYLKTLDLGIEVIESSEVEEPIEEEVVLEEDTLEEEVPQEETNEELILNNTYNENSSTKKVVNTKDLLDASIRQESEEALPNE